MRPRDLSKTIQASLNRQKNRPKALMTVIKISMQRPKSPWILKKKQKITGKWTPEVSHTDRTFFHFPLLKSKTLLFKQIQQFHLKKIESVFQCTIKFHEKSNRKMRALMVDQDLTQHDQDKLWREMIKPQEERQFQIYFF